MSKQMKKDTVEHDETEIASKRDAAMRRMLNTPPTPRSKANGKPSQPAQKQKPAE
jgi:hypothetical protein